MNNKILYNKIVKILNGEVDNYKEELENIRKELETEIITGGKINSSIKQAFKRLQKQNSGRLRFQNVLRNKDNNYTITNAYYLVTYTENQLPNELKPYIDTEKDNTYYEDFQFEKFKNTDSEISKISLDFNVLQKIYKYGKLKKKMPNIYTLQNGFTFDLQYFFDILALLNYKNIDNIEMFVSTNNIHPMNIISENGKAILLPIKMEENQVDEQLKLQEKIIKGEI